MASSFAASSAIKPVHQLIETASEISDTNIGMRLTLPEHKDELYELATTINDLLARIEKIIFQQKQFTSDASHEIRTPLSAIRGTLEVLIRKQREPDFYKEKITGVIQQVDRLDRLLEQLLQLARIDSSYAVVKHESINLDQIIDMVKTKWAAAAAERNINLHMHIEEGPVVFADKFYLEVILDNLINNAIKYGRENGNIYLSWDSVLKSLSIIDDGIGISPENLPNIFNRFYRADESRSSHVQGNGLGLSIVKKLADLQHISLNAVSQPGIGSTFILRFHP
jgi:signal transduction histidine kinase